MIEIFCDGPNVNVSDLQVSQCLLKMIPKNNYHNTRITHACISLCISLLYSTSISMWDPLFVKRECKYHCQVFELKQFYKFKLQQFIILNKHIDHLLSLCVHLDRETFFQKCQLKCHLR